MSEVLSTFGSSNNDGGRPIAIDPMNAEIANNMIVSTKVIARSFKPLCTYKDVLKWAH